MFENELENTGLAQIKSKLQLDVKQPTESFSQNSPKELLETGATRCQGFHGVVPDKVLY